MRRQTVTVEKNVASVPLTLAPEEVLLFPVLTGEDREDLMDQKSAGLNITIFFCQQIDPLQDVNRRALEKELGERIRFFPLPCSGRIDPLHLMRALESGADKIYLVTCPEGACHYREGNMRAKKRIAYTQGLIEEIGLERERLELIVAAADHPLKIDGLARELLARETTIKPSPLGIKT